MSEEQLNQSIPEPSQSPTPEVDSPAKSAHRQQNSKCQQRCSQKSENQCFDSLDREFGKKREKISSRTPVARRKPIAPTASDSATTTPPAVAAEVNSVPPKVAVKFDKKPVSKRTEGSFLKKVGVLWQSIVRLVRDLLPPSANQKLSDPILNAAIAAIMIVAVGLTLNSSLRTAPETSKSAFGSSAAVAANLWGFCGAVQAEIARGDRTV